MSFHSYTTTHTHTHKHTHTQVSGYSNSYSQLSINISSCFHINYQQYICYRIY